MFRERWRNLCLTYFRVKKSLNTTSSSILTNEVTSKIEKHASTGKREPKKKWLTPYGSSLVLGKSGKYVISTFGMACSGCNIRTHLVRREKVFSNKRRGADLLAAIDTDGFSVRDLMLRFFWENQARSLPSEYKRTGKNIKPKQNHTGFCCLLPGSELSLGKQIWNSHNASCLPWEDRRFL